MKRKLVLFLLVVALIIPGNVSAATADDQIQPYGSSYLSAYRCYPCTMGGGRVDFYFDVYGTRTMDEIGALSIQVFESVNNEDWYWVKTYSSSTYTTMLGSDTIYYHSSVSYYGISGRYYKAYVCIWAGKDGSGDSRSFWTDVEKSY